MTENKITDLTVIGDRSLTIPNGGRVLAGFVSPTIFDSPEALVLAVREQGISSLDPVVYSNPELLEDEESLETRLDAIKKDFPQTIAAFDDSDIELMLGRYPILESRFKEDQELLSSIPDALSHVKAVELVLRRLIIDGSVHTLKNSLDSYRAIASHNLYGDMADMIFENKAITLTLDEEGKFITIGQRLLRVKKLLGIQIQKNDEMERESNGEKDFKGQVALIRIRQKALWILKVHGDEKTIDASRVETFKSDIQDLIENLAMSYPHRLREIKRLYNIPDWGKREHWAEVPGGDRLSQAEASSFFHGWE